MSTSKPADLSLQALAARAQLGDRNALEELLRQIQLPLEHHIRAIVRDDDLAADVLQDTLIVICRKLHTLRQVEWVRAWVYRISTREAIRASKRSRPERVDSADEMATLPNTSESDVEDPDEELLAMLPEKLASVPPGAQVALRLHYLHSLTQMEVAEALEIPLGTVKSRIAYGLGFLRNSW